MEAPNTLRTKNKQVVLLTVFFVSSGVIQQEYEPHGKTITKEYYQEVLLRLCDAVRCKQTNLKAAKNWQIHPERNW